MQVREESGDQNQKGPVSENLSHTDRIIRCLVFCVHGFLVKMGTLSHPLTHPPQRHHCYLFTTLFVVTSFSPTTANSDSVFDRFSIGAEYKHGA